MQRDITRSQKKFKWNTKKYLINTKQCQEEEKKQKTDEIDKK